jgi:hypothetical protein
MRALAAASALVTDDSKRVCIRLTRSQIAQVQAGDEQGDPIIEVTASLDAHPAVDLQRHLAQLVASTSSDAKLSTSLLRGLYLFAALPKDGSWVGVVNLARSTGMSPSTTYRYLNTLVAAGILQRNPDTRGYRRTARTPIATASPPDHVTARR